MTRVRLSLVIALVALTLSACSDDASTVTSPSIPPTSFTFATSFTARGSATRTFDQVVTGTVAVTLTSVTPDVPLGIGIGIPGTAGSACNLTRAEIVRAGTAPHITLRAEPGTWCVRVWDPGTVAELVSFSMAVTYN